MPRAARKQGFVSLGQVAVVVVARRAVGEVHADDGRRNGDRQIGGNRAALRVRRFHHADAGDGAVGGRELQVVFLRGARHEVMIVAIAGRQPREGVIAVGRRGRRRDRHVLAGLDDPVAVVVPKVQVDRHARVGHLVGRGAAGVRAVEHAVVGRRVEPDRAAQAVAAGVAVAEIDGQVAARARRAADGRHDAAGDHDGGTGVVQDAVRIVRLRQPRREVDVVGQHRHAPGAVGQVAEVVVAVRIGFVGRDGDAVGPKHHGDVGDAVLARILHAVVVRVHPEAVADHARRRVAEIRAHEVLAVAQGQPVLVVAGHDVVRVGAGIAVGIRIGGLGHAHQRTGRRRDHDDVVVRQQAGEQVVAGSVGGRVGHQRLAEVVDAIAVGVGVEPHFHARHALFGIVLSAVAVGVPEDRVADRAVRRKAEIGVQIGVAAADRYVERRRRGGIVDVAEGTRRQIGVRRIHRDAIGAVGQSGEQVGARRARVRRPQEDVDAVAIEVRVEAHQHVRNARLLRAGRKTVAVEVFPDEVADRARAGRLETEILVQPAGVGDRRDAARVQRPPRVAGHRVAPRQIRIGAVHVDQVGVGGEQVREQVRAVARRRRGGDEGIHADVHRAVAVGVLVQVDRDVGDAFLERVALDAVAVPVVEDRVAERVAAPAPVAEVRPRHAAADDRHGRIVRRVGAVGVPRQVPLARAQHAGVGRDEHRVVARVAAHETEEAVGGRDVRRDGRAGTARRRARAQVDRHVRQPVLARLAVRLAAPVPVVPDRAFDGRLGLVAEVRRQVEIVGAVGRRVDVQIDRRRAVVRAALVVGVHARAARQRRRHDPHRVDARLGDRFEEVEAAGVGPVRDGRAGPVAQVDARRRREGYRHVGDAHVRFVLHAVAVQVAPDVVAERRRRRQDYRDGARRGVGGQAALDQGVGDPRRVDRLGLGAEVRLPQLEGHRHGRSAARIDRTDVAPGQRARGVRPGAGRRRGRRRRDGGNEFHQVRVVLVRQRHGLQRVLRTGHARGLVALDPEAHGVHLQPTGAGPAGVFRGDQIHRIVRGEIRPRPREGAGHRNRPRAADQAGRQIRPRVDPRGGSDPVDLDLQRVVRIESRRDRDRNQQRHVADAAVLDAHGEIRQAEGLRRGGELVGSVDAVGPRRRVGGGIVQPFGRAGPAVRRPNRVGRQRAVASAVAGQVVGHRQVVGRVLAFAEGIGADEGLFQRQRGSETEIRGQVRHGVGVGPRRVQVDRPGRRRGRRVARGQIRVGGVHRDDVVAVGQVGEPVGAAPVGLRGADQRVAGVGHAVAVEIVVQPDRHAGDARFGAVLRLVAQQAAARAVVAPYPVAQRVDALDEGGGGIRRERQRVAQAQPRHVLHDGTRVGEGVVDCNGEGTHARFAAGQRFAQPPLDVRHGRRRHGLDGGPRGAVVGRVVHDVVRARRRDVAVGGAAGHVRRAVRNGILQHQRQVEIRPTHADRAGIGVGDRIDDVAAGPRRRRIRRLGDFHARGTAGQPLPQRRAVVAVELLVVVARRHFLVGRQRARATAPQAEELVAHVAHRPAVVLGEVLEVQLVFGLDDLLGAVVELHDHQRVGVHEAEAGRIEQAGVAHRLEPRVAVGDQVAVVVEPRADVAQVVPDAFGRDGGARRAVVRRVRPRRLVQLQQVQVFLRHLVGAVREDLVGHRRNLVAHRHRARFGFFQRRRAVPRRAPDVVLQPQVVVGLDPARHRLAVLVQVRIADQPVDRHRTAGLDRAQVARRVGRPQRAAFMRQRELVARQRPVVGRLRPARISPRRAGRVVADVGPDVRQRVRPVVVVRRPQIGRARRIGRRRLHVGIHDQVVGGDDLDPQLRVGGRRRCPAHPTARQQDMAQAD